MRWKDLLWALAYPIYQLIGTFRHESAHALGALAFGGVIEKFVFLPTQGYWGYVDWEGPRNIFNIGAPYLLDLLTFLIFFTFCMSFPFRRRWIWLNLVILGVVSPLINSAYNYRPNPNHLNDVDWLLENGVPIAVHSYFILTLLLYVVGIFLLFTRAKVHRRPAPSTTAWTFIPLLVGGILLFSGCATTLLGSIELEEGATGTMASSPRPSPILRSATMTPTKGPFWAYYVVYLQVKEMLNEEYPRRGPEEDLLWGSDVREQEHAPGTVDGTFISGDWKIRLFDWDLEDRTDAIEVSVSNHETRFRWVGYGQGDELTGWLASGGLVPEAGVETRPEEWLIYTNNRYGYKFNYPPEADVFEFGVDTFELTDVPADMTAEEYRYYLYANVGPNVCVQLTLGDGYILFEAPENWEGNYTFCRKLGPGALGWSMSERTETIGIEDRIYSVEGHEYIKVDGSGDDHDEALTFKLPSGVRIEFGAYSSAGGAYDIYRAEELPVLIAILETFETIPRNPAPQ